MLSQNIAEQFGLKGNPFDSKALSASEQTLLPIAKAFVGREFSSAESQMVTNILRVPGGGRFVIEGEVGVGKTTFINYHRYLWEYEAQDLLFTPIQEIRVGVDWGVKDFLLNILGALVSKVQLLRGGEKIITQNRVFQEILILTRVHSIKNTALRGSITGFSLGFGIGVKKNETITVPQQISETQLFHYFELLVQEIKSLGYAGVFLPLDNFDRITGEKPEKIQKFFHRIRDILQVSDVYYAVIGYSGFYAQVINPIERVKSIFFTLPIYLPPLSEDQVLEVIEKRYELLSAKKFIKPVEDDFVRYLYRLHQGKIRSILDSLLTLIAHFPPYLIRTLSAREAKEILSKKFTERVSSVLTERELSVLLAISEKGKCTNAGIAKKLKISTSNVSRVLRELERHHFIYLACRKGKKLYYTVDEQLKIIENSLPMPGVDYSLSEIQKAFLSLLKNRKRLKLKEFCEESKLPINTVRREINKLIKYGLIKKNGYTRGLYYTAVSV